ncbi:hypothetical protein AWJ20_924 [Sugiyamaella lignohabitans]|uniref:Gylcosyl hydrolase 115 C-terminal domain-containing protein n=1 Tax=Sugiyamaella lignohabitans TaxID=796027 RepID=A0A167DA00_9ASCO|nr:uncharacterized protein AWJ20_924 [Sugiyamaella lignohabitans]ANB12662.1 hypothetical protein AWJ20_924 [Sugiyamaella lignohabitans]
MKFSLKRLLLAALPIAGVSALGGNQTVGFESQTGSLRLAGAGFKGEILLDGSEFWGVLRTAVDLAGDFGKVTGTNLTVQIQNANEKTGKYEYAVPVSDQEYKVSEEPAVIEAHGFETSGASANTVIIAGTIGKSKIIDQLISSGKIDVSQVQGKWEAYVSVLVDSPLPNVPKALVIAGSDKRGTTFGLYDISEQIGVSPFYYWGDVPPQSHSDIFALNTVKNQGSPSIKYRGLFLNDEAPCLTNWVEENFEHGKYGAGFNRHFYSLVFELILRSRGNYMWPTMWGSMFNVDDYENQPLADAFGIVMGTSHTEPLLRAKDEWPRFGEGIWQWNINEEGIRPFFKYGVERAKPYEGIYNLG